jgi:hypothetical protein
MRAGHAFRPFSIVTTLTPPLPPLVHGTQLILAGLSMRLNCRRKIGRSEVTPGEPSFFDSNRWESRSPCDSSILSRPTAKVYKS